MAATKLPFAFFHQALEQNHKKDWR